MNGGYGQGDRPNGVWDYVSPSRLNLWLRCPLAFRLKYVDGVPTPSAPAAFIGKMVHRGLERYYRQRLLGSTLPMCDVTAAVQEAWEGAAALERVPFVNRIDEQASRAQTIELIRAYLWTVPIHEPLPLAVEASLEAPLVDPVTGEDFGLPLVGVIDLVLNGASSALGPLIVDFKTAARRSELTEINHELQLTSYAYLFRDLYQVPEASLEIRQLVKTKIPQVHTHTFPARSGGHFRRLFAVIGAYLDDLSAGRFVYRPGLACGMCSFRETQCRAWLQ